MSAPKDHRALWQPKFPAVAKQCASCPFRIGNDKEFGEVIRRLRVKFGMPSKVHAEDIRHARFCVRMDAEHGDFVCHHTAYDGEMNNRPVTDYRQCAGATEAFRARVAGANKK
jgi:hypothetical protein